jgi:hypothetical protein
MKVKRAAVPKVKYPKPTVRDYRWTLAGCNAFGLCPPIVYAHHPVTETDGAAV